jgi:glucose-6-phosphate 1-dehydrogenase
MLTIIVFGASGDLARRKTFPSLFKLFRRGLIQNQCRNGKFRIIGYARSVMSRPEFHDKLMEFLSNGESADDAFQIDLKSFLDHCDYIHGDYTNDIIFESLLKNMQDSERMSESESFMRLFYLALPPSVFLPAAATIRKHLYVSGHVRLVVEKPFGHDLQSSTSLSAALRPLFSEDEIFRIDHYLGKEMVKNLLILRFGNIFFNAVWNRNYIKSVQIVFKETLGVEGRGGYFDEFGIIRDVMQNHLLQMLAIIAMDRPASLDAADIRNEKVKVLRSIRPARLEDIVLGQYTKSIDGTKSGYTDDETVSSVSNTPTFALATLYVRNERWEGVPFILRCGKALNEQKAEIRIQFDDVPGALFGPTDCEERESESFESPMLFPENECDRLARNELVLRVQPNEAVYMKLMVKRPGHGMHPMLSDLDLSYASRYSQLRIPDAYESLLLDILRGDQSNFVRDDELTEAWRIFTPALHQIDEMHIQPELYHAGSRGPISADEKLIKLGYRRSLKHSDQYQWPTQPL